MFFKFSKLNRPDKRLWSVDYRLWTNKGVVLLSVVIILLTIALIGASLVASFSSVNISARNITDQAKALYLAEAGIAHAVHNLRAEAGVGGIVDETIGAVTLGEGTYQVLLDFAQSLITSTGEVRGVRRTLQFQYKPL